MMTRFRNPSSLLAVVLTIALSPAVSRGQDALSPPPNDAAKTAEVAQLVAVLQSDAAPFDKAKACQRLALIGTKEAVPALASLLTDENLSGYARFGLEPIPDPSVDDALRDALEKLHGEILVGVINSIGFRRDAKAVAALARRVEDPAPEVAPKALVALGQIATAEAVDILERSLGRDSAVVRAAAAEGGLIAAERLLAQDQREASVRLYDAVRRADAPKQVRAAATRGAILARQSAGTPLLLEQLKANDADMVGMALRTSRELPGSDVTQSLLAALDTLPRERQVLLIYAIGDRLDTAALPAMRKWAGSGPQEVRSAAIHVLGQLGDASAATLLLEAALSGEPALAQAAQESLKQLRGSAVDDAIVTRLERANPVTRVVLLDLVSRLAVPSAIPAVLQAADDPDEQVRLAAIGTLGRITGMKEFPLLTDRFLAARSPEETSAAQDALKVAVLRMPQPDACVSILLERLPKAPVASKCLLIELLGSIGGTRALQAVSAAAEDSDEAIQDAATQALGKWADVDAAPVLLKLATTLQSEKLRVRTLRGYVRIVQQMSLSADQKLAMCDEAFRAAERDEERRLILNVLSHVPSAKALAMVLPHLANSALRDEAAVAAVAIAEKVNQTEQRVVAEAMQQVLKSGASGETAARARSLEKLGGANPPSP